MELDLITVLTDEELEGLNITGELRNIKSFISLPDSVEQCIIDKFDEEFGFGVGCLLTLLSTNDKELDEIYVKNLKSDCENIARIKYSEDSLLSIRKDEFLDIINAIKKYPDLENSQIRELRRKLKTEVEYREDTEIVFIPLLKEEDVDTKRVGFRRKSDENYYTNYFDKLS